MPTRLCGQVLQIHQDGEVITSFRGNNVGPILSLQDLLSAEFEEFSVTFHRYGDENLRFRLRRGNVESNIVEVGDYLVYRA